MSIIHITRYRMYRLRLNDGRYIYMTWHPYCGPTFFRINTNPDGLNTGMRISKYAMPSNGS